MNLIAEKYREDYLIIQLDNGAFHKAKRLQVPDNVILMFQPPHCPELNPIEQVWQYFKRRLRWLLPHSLDELRQHLFSIIKQLTHQTIASIAGRRYIIAALSVVSFWRIGITSLFSKEI